jgi:hypothetical protein
VIVQRRAGATRATSVAYDPGEAGEVTLTSRAVAVTVGDAIATAAATSAAIPATGTSNFFNSGYIGSRRFGLEPPCECLKLPAQHRYRKLRCSACAGIAAMSFRAHGGH